VEFEDVVFFDFVVADLADVLLLFFVVDFLVATGVGVAGEVAGVAVACCVVVLVKELVPAELDVAVERDAPPNFKVPVLPNCGGVIASTAPRPPTVPPAIKKNLLLIFHSLPLLC